VLLHEKEHGSKCKFNRYGYYCLVYHDGLNKVRYWCIYFTLCNIFVEPQCGPQRSVQFKGFPYMQYIVIISRPDLSINFKHL